MIWFPDPMVGAFLMRRIFLVVAFASAIKKKLKEKNNG
jgi:hypothetical protein